MVALLLKPSLLFGGFACVVNVGELENDGDRDDSGCCTGVCERENCDVNTDVVVVGGTGVYVRLV